MKANKESDLFRLGHILECCEKIIYLTTLLHKFDNFLSRWVEQDAMIRSFEIIGEASRHISEETKEKYPDIQWNTMRGMRNFVAHEYFGIDIDIIWDSAINDIPYLKQQIEQVIIDLENDNKKTIKNSL